MRDTDRFLEFVGGLLGVAFILLLLNVLTGCGSLKVSGGTTHEVKGKAEIVTRLEIDFSICDELEGTDKNDCIKQLLDILERVQAPTPITGSF